MAADDVRLKAGAVEWRLVDGEVIAVDLRTLDYLGVNGAGAVLWPLLAHGAPVDELVETLVATYGIDRERATTDVAAFLDALEERQIVERG